MDSKLQIDLSPKSALKILLYIAAGYLLYLFLPFFMVAFLALLIAITLEPFVLFLERHKLKRGLSALLIIIAAASLVAIFVIFILPALFQQLSSMVDSWPDQREKLEASRPFGNLFKRGFNELSSPKITQSLTKDMGSLVAFGQLTLGAITGFVLMLVLSIYFVLDGPGAYRWGLHFFPEAVRKKIDATARDSSKLVFAYVAGQVITSVIAAVYAFAVLKILDVPAALTLAVLAGIFDILPVLGFFVFTIPAVILALTVSPFTALLVLLLYSFYQLLESYLIIPRVYENRLRLSDLAVLLSLTMASIVAGIPGAIVILPVVAAYPMIEKIWFKELLPAGKSNKNV